MHPEQTSPMRKSFSDRVRYAAKSLCRGHSGAQFEACFAEADAPHVVAVLMRRAEKNAELKKAIKSAFRVTRWDDVPWTKGMSRFRGMDSRAISADAQRVLDTADRMMGQGLLTGQKTF